MNYKTMTHCVDCGALLELRHLDGEGDVPFCPSCGEWRFPIFNTAVSMVVLDESREHVLLIRQYGRPHYILVAGYVARGESAEEAVRREVAEETGLEVVSATFNRSRYFEPSNTLMLNFAVVARGVLRTNREVDSHRWFTMEEALRNIKEKSLARWFLESYAGARPVQRPAEPPGVEPGGRDGRSYNVT